MNIQKFTLFLFSTLLLPTIQINAALTPGNIPSANCCSLGAMAPKIPNHFSCQSFAQQGVKLPPCDTAQAQLWRGMLQDPELLGQQPGSNWEQWALPAAGVGIATVGVARSLWKMREQRKIAQEDQEIDFQRRNEIVAPQTPTPELFVPVVSKPTQTSPIIPEKTPWWKHRYVVPTAIASTATGSAAGIAYLWNYQRHIDKQLQEQKLREANRLNPLRIFNPSDYSNPGTRTATPVTGKKGTPRSPTQPRGFVPSTQERHDSDGDDELEGAASPSPQPRQPSSAQDFRTGHTSGISSLPMHPQSSASPHARHPKALLEEERHRALQYDLTHRLEAIRQTKTSMELDYLSGTIKGLKEKLKDLSETNRRNNNQNATTYVSALPGHYQAQMNASELSERILTLENALKEQKAAIKAAQDNTAATFSRSRSQGTSVSPQRQE